MCDKNDEYKNCCIYKIVCNVTGDTYYGSTNDLSTRIGIHKSAGNTCSSKPIIRRGDFHVAVVEAFKYKLKSTRYVLEDWYIRSFPCVNQRGAIVARGGSALKQKRDASRAKYQSEPGARAKARVSCDRWLDKVAPCGSTNRALHNERMTERYHWRKSMAGLCDIGVGVAC